MAKSARVTQGTSGRVVSVEGNGSLTIEAGTIITGEGMAKAGSTIYIGGNGKAIMNGGKVIATALRGNSAVGAVNVDGNAAGMSKGTGQYVISNEGGTVTNRRHKCS